jgi:hypothetical protein
MWVLTSCYCKRYSRVSATEVKVTRAVQLIKTAPFYHLLAKALNYHCFVPDTSSSVSTLETANTVEYPPGDCTQPSSPSGAWRTPGWKWAPGPEGPSELIVYGLGSPVISSVSCDQVCKLRPAFFIERASTHSGTVNTVCWKQSFVHQRSWKLSMERARLN